MTEHLFRGLVAAAAIGVALLAWPNVWPALVLLPCAAILMRGCPTCWTVGLLQTLMARAGRRPGRPTAADA